MNMPPALAGSRTRQASMPSRRTWLISGCAAAAGMCLPASATTTPGSGPSAGAAAAHDWLPQSRRIGQGRLRMLGFTVYDAALFALADFEAAAFAAHPLVLEIQYRRSLAGSAIADYSLKEMRRGPPVDEGTAERWLQFMRRAFPDVQDGDRLTGQWQPGSATTRFAANGGPPASLQDAAFGPRFFGIWLAPQTPRPDLREQLLGLKSPG